MGDNTEKADRRTPIWKVLHFGARNFLARKFRYTWEPIVCGGPCLIIANHVTNFDPFFVGLAHKNAPLSYVASEHIFRLGFVSKLITRLIDPIPRSKGASGADTVKAILRRIKNGESVVLFAEGDCTWDGLSQGIFPATGKLAKVCGAPLVTFRIEGGYLSRPRWAKKSRRGKMHGAPVRVYTPEELKSMAPNEVTEAINRDIFVDAWADQRKNRVAYRCKAPAEGLERALFICPECNKPEKLASVGNRFFCTACGAEWMMDEYGFLNGPQFSTIAEWDAWQKRAVGQMKGRLLFAARGVLTDIGGNTKGGCELALNADDRRIVRAGGSGAQLSEIDNMAMVKTNRLLMERGGDTQRGYYEFKTGRGVLRPYLMLWQVLRGEGDK